MTDMNSLSGNHTKVNDDLSKRSGSSWSKEEDEFLRDNYAKLGPKIVGEKLGRTRSAVRTRAHEIGASSKQRFKEWSDEEDEFLRENYPALGARLSGEKLGRSTCSVQNRVRKLNLRSDLIQYWTRKECDFFAR